MGVFAGTYTGNVSVYNNLIRIVIVYTYSDQTFRIEPGVQKQYVVANAFNMGVRLADRFARKQHDLTVRSELVVPQTVAQPLQSDHNSVVNNVVLTYKILVFFKKSRGARD